MGDVRAILVRFLSTHGAVNTLPLRSVGKRRPLGLTSLSLVSPKVILAFHDLRHAISTSRTLQRKVIDRLGGVKLRTSFVAMKTVEQVRSTFCFSLSFQLLCPKLR